jgi:hypothetical protein
MSTQNAKSARASIAAMPKPLRPILLALVATALAAAVLGCGGSSGPDPSIPKENANTLLAKIEEIKANVDVGSCLVAAAKTDDLLSDVADLPSSVNDNVKQALDDGANNLKLLLNDPSKCQGHTETTTTESTTAPTTTEETTTERTQPQTTTTRTPTQTQTQPTTPTQTQPNVTTTPGASGGIGPG